MNPQMTPAATKLIAIGMKISAFTPVSYRTRSARMAMSRPMATVTA